MRSTLTKEFFELEYPRLKTFKGIADHFGIPKTCVRRYATKVGFDYIHNKRGGCIDNFFSYDTEESFYIAGIFAADACLGITKIKGNAQKNKPGKHIYFGLASRDATIYLDRKKEAAFAFQGWETKEFFEDKGISKEVLEESYLRTKSISKTAAELKLTMGTTYNYLLKNKIQIFESPQAKKEKFLATCTPEALKESYKTHGTISGVAREFGIGKTTASRYLASAGIV